MDMLNLVIFQAFGAGTAHSSGTPEFIPGFSGIRVVRSLVFCVVIFFYRSLFVLLVIVLSVLWFTASDYPFVIFKLLLNHVCRMLTLIIDNPDEISRIDNLTTDHQFHICYRNKRRWNKGTTHFVLLILLVFCVVLLCVFTYLVPCCDVRYDFRNNNNKNVRFVFTSSCL